MMAGRCHSFSTPQCLLNLFGFSNRVICIDPLLGAEGPQKANSSASKYGGTCKGIGTFAKIHTTVDAAEDTSIMHSCTHTSTYA